MKKLFAIILVIVTIFSFSACKSNGGNSLEDKYYNAAQEYINNNDYDTALKVIEEGLANIPDSEKLASLKAEITNKNETTTQAPATTQPTEETIIKDFKALRANYYKWFDRFEFEYDEKAGVMLEDYSTKFPVRDATVKSKADLDNLFLKYCTKDVYDYYCRTTVVKFVEENGVLYCIFPEIYDYGTTVDRDYTVENLTDTSYQVTYYEDYNDEGELYSEKVVVPYSLNADGKWVFGMETRVPVENATKKPVVNNNNSNANNYPNGEEIVGEIVDEAVNGIGSAINGVENIIGNYF